MGCADVAEMTWMWGRHCSEGREMLILIIHLGPMGSEWWFVLIGIAAYFGGA